MQVAIYCTNLVKFGVDSGRTEVTSNYTLGACETQKHLELLTLANIVVLSIVSLLRKVYLRKKQLQRSNKRSFTFSISKPTYNSLENP